MYKIGNYLVLVESIKNGTQGQPRYHVRVFRYHPTFCVECVIKSSLFRKCRTNKGYIHKSYRDIHYIAELAVKEVVDL